MSSVYPKLALDVRVKRNAYMAEMLESQEVDLMVTTHRPSTFKALNLRTCLRPEQSGSGESGNDPCGIHGNRRGD